MDVITMFRIIGIKLSISFFAVISLGGCALDMNLSGFSSVVVPEIDNPVTEPTPDEEPVVETTSYLRGINIMDLGISSSALPGIYGTNYTKPSLTALQTLKGRGLSVVRIPFLWERIQPTLGGALDTAYLGYLIQVLKDANTAGLKVIVDMHNYASYTSGGVTTHFGDEDGPTKADYADAWTKIATAIKAEPEAYAALYAYDIMNEPAGIFDTRNTVPTSTAYSVASFSAGTESWAAATSTGTISVAHDAATESLKVTGHIAAAARPGPAYAIVRAFRAVTTTIGNGKTFRIKGRTPANLPGTAPRVRMIYHSSPTWYVLDPVMITKGQEFTLHFTPDEAAFFGNHSHIGLDLIVDGVVETDPNIELYIDEIWQGDTIIGKAPEKTWEEYSQEAVTAIRNIDTEALLMIEGYFFASASRWSTLHPVPWINDPNNKIMYHAHHYFDHTNEGSYSESFADETALAVANGYSSVTERTLERLKVFTDWVKTHNVQGFLGEFGWPNADVVGSSDATSWNAVGEAVLTHLDNENMGATIWATGSWLGPTTNILNTYQLSPFIALSQAEILERHLGTSP